MKTAKKDNIFGTKQLKSLKFKFDGQVADVFQDMINRSLPGYSTIIDMVGIFGGIYAQPKTKLYDLGCSLGAASIAMRHNVGYKNCKIIAVDNSQAMVERCKAHLKRDIAVIPVEVLCGDIEKVNIKNASVVVLNFTLQFINPERRIEIIKRIYNGLVPKGILILSEKISFEKKENQLFFDSLHEEFKRFNGYSELEISQKRSALENVLIRDTATCHNQRLKKVGFTTINEWFHCLNFVSFIAQK